MVHCGYEATAVNDTLSHPLKAVRAALRGPEIEAPMAPEIALDKARPAEFVFERQLEHEIKRLSDETPGERASSAA
jgi:hypothetical protein